MRHVVRELGSAGPLFLFAITAPMVGLFVVTATSTTWLPWFGQDLGSLAVFCVLGVLLSGLCLLPSQAVSLVAGYLYGASLGTVLCLVCVVFAALLGYLFGARVVGSRIMDAIAREPRAGRVHRALLGRSAARSVWLIALLRLSPITPFAASNLLLASFRVTGRVFLLGTLIGVAPRLVAVSLVGAELSEFDWDARTGWGPTVVAIVATVIFLAVISWIARRALARETGEEQQDAP